MLVCEALISDICVHSVDTCLVYLAGDQSC